MDKSFVTEFLDTSVLIIAMLIGWFFVLCGMWWLWASVYLLSLAWNVPAGDLMLWGFVAHLVADWLLQNDWMAKNKVNLTHPAAYVHSGIHFVAMMFVFPPQIAFAIAVIHALIDTRKPVEWWRDFYRQTNIPIVALGVDQTMHIAVVAGFALLVGR